MMVLRHCLKCSRICFPHATHAGIRWSMTLTNRLHILSRSQCTSTVYNIIFLDVTQPLCERPMPQVSKWYTLLTIFGKSQQINKHAQLITVYFTAEWSTPFELTTARRCHHPSVPRHADPVFWSAFASPGRLETSQIWYGNFSVGLPPTSP